MTTSNYLVENFTFPASGIARRTRTRTKTGPAGSTSTGTDSSPLIPKLAKRGSEAQRASIQRQKISSTPTSSNPHTQKDLSRLKRTSGVGDFLKVPEPLLYSSLKTRVVDREKTPRRFQADASKESEVGDKLKEEDRVKARETLVPTIRQALTLSSPFAPVDVKPLKIAKWTGSKTSSLQPAFSSEVSTYHASSAKTRALSERDTNLLLHTSTDATNTPSKCKRQHARSLTTRPSSVRDLPKDFTSIATTHTLAPAPPVPVSTRASPHHKTSSLGGIFHRRSFWPREVADLASTKRRNRHATTYSLDVTTATTTTDQFKRHAMYSHVGPPPVPPVLIPTVGNTGLDSIVRAYHNSIKLSPLTVVPLALVTSQTRTDTEGGIVYHPIVKELMNEVDEALRSW